MKISHRDRDKIKERKKKRIEDWPQMNGLKWIKDLRIKENELTVKEIAEKLDVNRTFPAGNLRALENEGYVMFKSIGPAKIYFNKKEGMF